MYPRKDSPRMCVCVCGGGGVKERGGGGSSLRSSDLYNPGALDPKTRQGDTAFS